MALPGRGVESAGLMVGWTPRLCASHHQCLVKLSDIDKLSRLGCCSSCMCQDCTSPLPLPMPASNGSRRTAWAWTLLHGPEKHSYSDATTALMHHSAARSTSCTALLSGAWRTRPRSCRPVHHPQGCHTALVPTTNHPQPSSLHSASMQPVRGAQSRTHGPPTLCRLPLWLRSLALACTLSTRVLIAALPHHCAKHAACQAPLKMGPWLCKVAAMAPWVRATHCCLAPRSQDHHHPLQATTPCGVVEGGRWTCRTASSATRLSGSGSC